MKAKFSVLSILLYPIVACLLASNFLIGVARSQDLQLSGSQIDSSRTAFRLRKGDFPSALIEKSDQATQPQFSATIILDEFNDTTVGIPHGILYSDALYGRGAVFSQSNESRIQYPFSMGLPKEGTLEFIVKIDRGYWYRDYQLRFDSGRALLFTTDIQSGDVTWPGSTWLYVYSNGDIKFHIAGEKYNPGWDPKYILWARGTSFKFKEWHVIGVSYGSEGQWIMVDGKIVASKPENTQPLGAGGNHSSPVDIPTIGESVPGFWPNNRWEGGFEGIVESFRASSKQKDWILYKRISSLVSIPDTSAAPGDTIDIPVLVDDLTGKGIFSFGLTVETDTSVLLPISAFSTGTIAESWGEPTWNVSDGQISIGMASTTPLSGNGPLVFIKYRVNQAASNGNMTKIQLTALFNEGDPPAITDDGLFTVKEEGAPEPPQNLRAIPGDSQITLRWDTNSEEDMSHYIVYRSLNASFFPARADSIGQVNHPNTEFLDIGLQNGATYFYRIRAVNTKSQKSIPGNEASATSRAITISPWFQPSPSPIFKNLSDIHILDANTAIAVGNDGTIVKTADGGFSWLERSSGTRITLRSVYFVDANTGWTVGNSGTILKTTDGGNTWNSQTSGTNRTLYSVHFVDSNIGWVVGYERTILKTSNGGETWVGQFSEYFYTWLEDVHFINADTGVAVGSRGSGKVYRTTNGGENWEEINLGVGWIKDVHFGDDKLGWAVGIKASRIHISTDLFGGINIDIDNPRATIWKTTDGGITWEANTFSSETWLNSVFFIDNNLGWVASSNGMILKTIDGGNSWFAQTSGVFNSLTAVQFLNSESGWAVGSNGTIIETTDGGNSWSKYKSGPSVHLRSTYFIDNYAGWAVGGFSGKGKIIKTVDGGFSWTEKTVEKYLNSIYFIDSQTGWTVSDRGEIFKTTDGGTVWNKIADLSPRLYSIYFVNDQIGWAVGGDYDPYIFKTTNGGNTWSEKELFGGGLNSVFFINSQTGFAIGKNGTFYRTKDGGNRWSRGEGLPQKTFYSTNFVNSQLGWAVGDRGMIYKTTNGGESWSKIKEWDTNNPTLYSVYFSNTQIGYAAGWSGTILNTADGGNSWTPQESGTSKTLKTVFFVDSQTGYAVGDEGIILKTITGGIPTSVDEAVQTGSPQKFILSHNYPNPFNPETTIEYQLPKSSEITIKIYNLRGQLVKTLVDQKQAAGYYSINWNGKDDAGREVASGVYFYRLRAKDYVQTRKMALVR